MKQIFEGQRYANVTATLALVVALTGTAYAAVTRAGCRRCLSGAG